MLLFCLLLWLYMHIETSFCPALTGMVHTFSIFNSRFQRNGLDWDDPRSGGLWMGQLTGALPF
jgi:hypothetical protein